MELSYADTREHHGFPDGLQQLPSSVPKSRPDKGLPTCAEDVIITSEFQRRKTRPENPALELAALKHLTNFLSTGPFVVLNQLATVLVQVCDASSAGVTLEERRTADILQCGCGWTVCLGPTGMGGTTQPLRDSD